VNECKPLTDGVALRRMRREIAELTLQLQQKAGRCSLTLSNPS
jgi:hypothetical protein